MISNEDLLNAFVEAIRQAEYLSTLSHIAESHDLHKDANKWTDAMSTMRYRILQRMGSDVDNLPKEGA